MEMKYSRKASERCAQKEQGKKVLARVHVLYHCVLSGYMWDPNRDPNKKQKAEEESEEEEKEEKRR